jgi:hypothetical protein
MKGKMNYIGKIIGVSAFSPKKCAITLCISSFFGALENARKFVWSCIRRKHQEHIRALEPQQKPN